MADIQLERPTLYKLKNGDVFRISVQQVNDGTIPFDASLLGADRVRLFRVVRVFGKHIRIPHIKKTWVLELYYHGEDITDG